MRKLWILLMVAPVFVAGCGEVVVFGHVVREKPASPEAKADAPPPAPHSPAASSSSEHTSVTAAPPSASSPPVASAAIPASAPSPTDSSAASPAASSLPPVATAVPPAVSSPSAASPPAPSPSKPSSLPASAQSSPAHVVTAVRVSLAQAAANIIAAGSAFSADALAAEITSELRARRLLSEQGPGVSGTAEVTIDELNSRPTSNAVFFGYQMMAGTLTGNVRVAASGGGDSPSFKIVAASRWNVAVSGEDKNPLKPLYHEFAVLTADRLEGIAPTQDSLAGNDSH
jgi:hypothetical protein